MAGSSCDCCIFSQYQDQTQIGCALNRLNIYENIDILNNENNGFYKVLPQNICTAKRDKKWLSANPRNPIDIVKKELFPKIQLILILEEVNDNWLQFFSSTDFSQYSVVDILIFDNEIKYIKSLGYLMHKNNIFLHTCIPIEYPINPKRYRINNCVRSDCQFYLLSDNFANHYIDKWPYKLNDYLNKQCKSIFMAYDQQEFDNKLIYTPLHFMFDGNGTQTIEEKIKIHCINNNQTNLIVPTDDILNER